MAIVNYSPWQDAANVGQGLGSSLTNLLIQLPQIRQQAALNQAHIGLLGAQQQHTMAQTASEPITSAAHAAYYRAEADRAVAQQGLYGAQKGEIDTSEAAKKQLGDALFEISLANQTGGNIGPHVNIAVDALAKLPHKDRAALGEQLAQMLNMSNPRFQQQLGLGQHGIVPVSSQGSLYNAVTGQTETQMPQKLGYGQNLVSPEGTTLAQGRDRPLADAIHSSVYGNIARSYFDPYGDDASRASVLESIPQFLQALPGAGMPTNAPPIVPGRDSIRPRFNPKTSKVEHYDPATKQWK